jgi:predicted small metal-binding protein
MAYHYTCGICDEDFMHDERSDLIDMVQEHARDEHDTDMKRTEIREDITES